ncbi:MAG: sensor histidine kinase [Bacillaceae bacterium]|nr:sensor histidine kinase [Caldibacillus debilis]
MTKGKTTREPFLGAVFLILAAAFFGEMKVTPFNNSFRFSLGSAVFFFGLISFTTISPIFIGVCTGFFVTGFRIALDMLTGETFAGSLPVHLPAAFYYMSFALLAKIINFRRYMDWPIRAGFLGAALDFTSNAVELAFRHFFGEPFALTYQNVAMMMLFGILRSFSVIGLYNIFMIRHLRAIGEARQQELERLVMINTGLYEETFYLQKSIAYMEEITRKSYDLYSLLLEGKKADPHSALVIAEHIHEVKKDAQRIFSGLSKLIGQEPLRRRLPISELCGMVMRANEKFAELLGKKIRFTHACRVDLSTDHVYALLSVLNNLVANAVEAIPSAGTIHLQAELKQSDLVFEVTDSGTGIAKEDADWIFHPGFTTKYDPHGNPSTGIGLTHARDIVQSLQGQIRLVSSRPGQTIFRLSIPTGQLLRKEERK